MSHFTNGFADELAKIAMSPETKAWALSRAITSGAGGGLMSAATFGMSNRNKPKKQRVSLLKGAIATAALAATLGLGKGLLEKELERKAMSMISKGSKAARRIPRK